MIIPRRGVQRLRGWLADRRRRFRRSFGFSASRSFDTIESRAIHPLQNRRIRVAIPLDGSGIEAFARGNARLRAEIVAVFASDPLCVA